MIEALNREQNGRIAIFYDPNQNIYNDENAIPSTDAVFNLKLNCRNTQAIHSFSIKGINADVQSSPRVPQGITPSEHVVDNARQYIGYYNADLTLAQT